MWQEPAWALYLGQRIRFRWLASSCQVLDILAPQPAQANTKFRGHTRQQNAGSKRDVVFAQLQRILSILSNQLDHVVIALA
jgi:hypothetical protein